MKVAFLVVRSDHASVFHRCLQYLPYLLENGFEATVITIPKTFYKRVALFRRLRCYDGIVLHRKLFNLCNFLPLRLFARKLIFDLDDALFLRDSKAPSLNSGTRTIRFRRTARKADLVICGNAWLQGRVQAFARHTAVFPTVVDLNHYEPLKKPEKGQTFRAAWIGGRSTLFYLERLLPALAPLAREIPDFRLRVIADAYPSHPEINIEKIPWSRQGEAEALRACDLGLMPLTEDAWSEGKCGLKLLQYSALGLPSVCTPTQANQRIVDHGISGFHARDPDSWRESILNLWQDPALRAAMGRKAHEIVKQAFSLSAYRKPFLDQLQETFRT